MECLIAPGRPFVFINSRKSSLSLSSLLLNHNPLSIYIRKKDKIPPTKLEISPRIRRCPLRRTPENISYGNAYKMDGIAKNGYTALSKNLYS
jgi:hypothetical protein